MIQTERLVLRPFTAADRPAFAALNADPRVTEWLAGPLTRDQSDALADRLNAQIAADGFGFWAAASRDSGALVGMIGLRRTDNAPPAPCLELGWRLSPDAQGSGLATEGARAALAWRFANLPGSEILAWTAATNVRSQAVMRRIGMAPDPARDFDHPLLAIGHPLRRHLVFVAQR